VSAICFAFTGLLSYRIVAFILLVLVSLIAVVFDIIPVLFSAILSAFIWDFFFIPPRFAVHVHTTEDTILLLMYFIISMINGILTFKIRQIEKTSRLKEERANSVKLYNTILDSLSHELRTPIAAIIGAADNLQQNKFLDDSDKEQLIEVISKSSLRLNQQVENLLNISRLESGHIQPNNNWCDIPELVYDIVKHVEENNPGRIINISINQQMPLCRIDKGMLEQILYNLLNNAAIHTHQQSKIEINASCHSDLLEFIIEDNGIGFGDMDTKEIFNKLARAQKENKNNSGLGLSIVKGFTEALGGHVELSPSKHSGARFLLTFPVKTSSEIMDHE
jgi:two-component system, OmpR family, sensor histidine kinase KdpD